MPSVARQSCHFSNNWSASISKFSTTKILASKVSIEFFTLILCTHILMLLPLQISFHLLPQIYVLPQLLPSQIFIRVLASIYNKIQFHAFTTVDFILFAALAAVSLVHTPFGTSIADCISFATLKTGFSSISSISVFHWSFYLHISNFVP